MFFIWQKLILLFGEWTLILGLRGYLPLLFMISFTIGSIELAMKGRYFGHLMWLTTKARTTISVQH